MFECMDFMIENRISNFVLNYKNTMIDIIRNISISQMITKYYLSFTFMSHDSIHLYLKIAKKRLFGISFYNFKEILRLLKRLKDL